MKLDTERLELIALDAHRMRLWLDDLHELEKELDCTYKAEELEGHFRKIVEGQLALTEESAEKYYWYSFWFLIRKSDRTVVGSADFKKGPDKNGEVEIGYGLGREFEGNGYMTEAVGAMCEWAKRQPGVAHVIAETYLDNNRSQNVLTRCGFFETRRGDSVWWRL
ncbi:MAG: GNAT family N-acetyltransferase [Oscillospiraceae bacterium]|nr:GNAT family N-acetyltransferase [Oscillospiraceae bacterium]